MTKLILLTSFIFLLVLSSFSQSTGELEVRVTTSQAGGKYKPKHCVAVWIEDENGNFKKTLLAYANKYKRFLVKWKNSTSKAGKAYNTVDAISGASQNQHKTRSCKWNGTDFNRKELPDGQYRLCFELTDRNAAGNYSVFTITKGPDSLSLTPANKPSFNNISINWYPEYFTDCNGDIEGTAFIDNCEECVGGNTGKTPCTDCNGDSNGTAFLDICGDCVGGNTGKLACNSDCNGEPGGSAYLDSCNVCVGGTTGKTACSKDCNGDWGGTAYMAAAPCQLCVGGYTGKALSDCFDCSGKYGGTAYIDACGDCASGSTGKEPNEACKDCSGVIYGTAYIDDCGNCVGGLTYLQACNTLTESKNLNEDALNIYPNPCVEGQLTLEFGDIRPEKIAVYNMSGTELCHFTGITGFLNINKAFFKPGLYIISVVSQEKTYSSKIIIK